MSSDHTLDDAVALARENNGLAVVATLRENGTIQASMVNVGLLPHPDTKEQVLAFVTYGKVKLKNLRARPQVTTTFQQGWKWALWRGSAVAGPDDPQPWLDNDRLRTLRREVFVAAGGTHDDWDEYDRVMAEQGRALVFVRVERIYGD